MARKKVVVPEQENFMEPNVRTGILVPLIRQEVEVWRANNYKGATETTRYLLKYWFSDHPQPDGSTFRYRDAQREAIETLVYIYEVKKIRRSIPLIMEYRGENTSLNLPRHDEFARYAIKMATGSGKTKVMAMVVVWQYFCALKESPTDYADTYLLLAPNVIVRERLAQDFDGSIFRTDPLIPPEWAAEWQLQCYVGDQAEVGHTPGALYLTNIQQLYEREEKNDEPAEMTAVLGSPAPSSLQPKESILSRIVRRGNCLLINDEAHHTHDPESAWNKVIAGLHASLKADHHRDLQAQLDFSATPRYSGGQLFEWTIYDYPLKRAILDRIVKRPIKGVASGIKEEPSKDAGVRYSAYLTAGVERWREYGKGLTPKRPVLFVMMGSSKEADEAARWLRDNYSGDFAGDKLLVIHTDNTGQVTARELDAARTASREIDKESSPINCIVSVLMLREGWDVRSVTVVVGLRAYSSTANILPEQTVGRGLRLMSPEDDKQEYVDVIGSDGFLKFVEDLEKIEEVKFDTFTIGKDKVPVVSIHPVMPERAEYDIEVPFLTPLLERSKAAQAIIRGLDVDVLPLTFPLSVVEVAENKVQSFTYEGFDMINREKVLFREYSVPRALTAEQVLTYYTQITLEQIGLEKLPLFNDLAPKIQDFVKQRLFGGEVDLDDPQTVAALKTKLAMGVTVGTFLTALKPRLVEETDSTLVQVDSRRKLSAVAPYAWGRQHREAAHTVFNLAAGENEFELLFGRFLDEASDVQAFAKLPKSFKFQIDYTDGDMSLRAYEPDFIARRHDPTAPGGYSYWVLETKGLEGPEVRFKDARARQWAEYASQQTGQAWHYLKVPEKRFKDTRPSTLGELATLLRATGGMLF